MRTQSILASLIFISFFAISCKKNPDTNPGSTRLSYEDSVFYLKSNTYTIAPKNSGQGTYTAFPDNLNINPTTGVITISLKGNDGQSQTGLRYKIKFTSNDSVVDSTFITIAGINYADKFYKLSQNDSIIAPVYNADVTKALPSGNYRSDNNKLAINSANGQIDIKETIRRDFFDNQLNTSWKEVTIKYTTDDNSNASNSLDIILYYYNTVNDIPSNVSALMQAHQKMNLGIGGAPIPSTPGPVDDNLDSDLSLFKPRPPCIVIVGH